MNYTLIQRLMIKGPVNTNVHMKAGIPFQTHPGKNWST